VSIVLGIVIGNVMDAVFNKLLEDDFGNMLTFQLDGIEEAAFRNTAGQGVTSPKLDGFK
jgi:hypothetical protein